MPSRTRACTASALALLLLLALLAPALAWAGPGDRGDLEDYRWFRYGLPRAERTQPPTGPTRDQTSPFGLEALGGEMKRGVAERGVGERFKFDVRSTRLLLKATLRPLRPLEIYGLIGQADLDSPAEDADFDGDFGLAWGGGARLTLVRERERADIALFIEGRYLQFESEAPRVLFPGPGGTTVLADEEFRWREWEGRAGISWRYLLFRPVLGLRYSDAEADDIVRSAAAGSRLRLRATENAGGFVGLTLYFDTRRRIGLTAEVSFPDQLSGQVGLRAWF